MRFMPFWSPLLLSFILSGNSALADSDPVIQLKNVSKVPGLGIVWLEIDGGGATNFVIERSQDLINWQRHLNVYTKITVPLVADRVLTGEEPRMFYRTSLRGRSISEIFDAWSRANLSNYQFRFTRVCMCEPSEVLSGTVTVSMGEVTSVENVRDKSGMPVENPNISDFKSIEELFELIQSEKEKADILAVAFDSVLNYPKQIDMDYAFEFVDDEIRFEITGLEPIE